MPTDRRLFSRLRDAALAEEGAAARAIASTLTAAARKVANDWREGGREAAEAAIESIDSGLEDALFEINLRFALSSGVASHAIARAATRASQRRALVSGGKQDSYVIPGFDEASLLRRYVQVGIEDWIRETSRLETATTKTQLASILRSTWDASQTLDPITEPRDIGWLIGEFMKTVAAQTEARAVLMARTTMIWSANEAAELAYRDAGVTVVEWMTADDELLCPFCAAMDGTRIDIGRTFAAQGDRVTGRDEAGEEVAHTVGIDVKHPPLHPHCRCSLLPVVE